ncbi:uncharacterized protein LOC128266229 [Drosophila gunungcola]|uniref:Lipocalin/cytosolic fatty-acid binding domain-containing protein n=1 Tax=Drosophila gunungcola TaxID=103775 RepID=A0A9Q0BTN2_9MUSC|nr:uncharacterized protein LOC128266229 [Drosophila gunungcola]KAI8044297.1 hypothetical protein M5D96_000448 [Drosophila gunungcola]
MCKSVMICLALVASISMVLVQGQTQTQQTCAQATSLDFNNQTYFSGQWFEVARNPAASVACITLNVGFWQNTNMLVNVSHSSSSTSLLADVHESANITLVAGSTAGYNVSIVKGNQQEHVFIKLLQFVNNTYLTGCRYTGSDASTSAGFILARSNYTAEGVKIANTNASAYYSNFQASTYGNVTQLNCYASSAGQTGPLTLISGFLALALLLIKA